jgi:bifunctional polynucleotide phosphatase/kinase
MEWTHDDMIYLVGVSADALEYNKFACFDLDDTLITTKSGKKFAEDGGDWKFLFANIPKKIEALYENGFSIVIITNQAGLTKKKDGTEWWKNKIENVVKQLEVPVAIYVALDHDHHRKPYPTFWNMITDKKKVKYGESFYCGDACGRKNDFNDTDLKFASNCGIKFVLPENLFNKQKITIPQVTYPINFNKIQSEPPFKFTPIERELIIMVGVPGSGKSTFVKKYIAPHNYGIINRDTSKTIQKCIKECIQFIKSGRSIVIDNTNPTIESREKFIKIATDRGYMCRCFIMNTDVALAKHNMCYRHYISGGQIDTIPNIVYNIYKKKYDPPERNEGFEEINTIDFSLDSNIDISKYKMYYLGKKI